MTTTISPASSDAQVQNDLTPEERAAEILKGELPRLMNDAAMLVARPFRFVWDAESETASTDCLAEIRMSPRPFIEGEREVGFGSLYHETGHIRFSPYGVKLLARARKEGGDALQSIVNIILDRKDDALTIDRAPGFADTLRRRLLVIRTLARRKEYRAALARMPLPEQSRFLRHAPPRDCFEDFFLAAKCGKSARFKATRRAMNFVRLSRLRRASPEELFWAAKRVLEILEKESPREEREQAKQRLTQLFVEGERAGRGAKVSGALQQAIHQAVKSYLSGLRTRGVEGLLRYMSQLGMVHPGPLSTGVASRVPVEKVPPSPAHVSAYAKLREEVAVYVEPLVKALRAISTPSEFELFGREEGELDLSEVGRIAARLTGFYRETVVERDIDAEIHLALDASGSMAGAKIAEAKKIAVVFSEAVRALERVCAGRVWSFNSKKICDFGAVSPESGFVAAEGDEGNSDTHMLKAVGTELLKSPKRRRVLIVLCDDGPDNVTEVKRLSQQLLARGVIIVHLLVGVHGTPDIYPIELVYDSMEECLAEFGDLLKTIVSHLK